MIAADLLRKVTAEAIGMFALTRHFPAAACRALLGRAAGRRHWGGRNWRWRPTPGAAGEAAAIAIGGAVGRDAMFGGPITGASMNPARSLGPAIASGEKPRPAGLRLGEADEEAA
jgi:glycerol uptake facilitator-like aquaporin